ncbi:hypothetical protein LCGC14_2563240 [marine sediment metagenome]|uniref:Uncharacterized protein n=1 Tax=marine sediment metagenome TaxID=412755 RepID=A0A0F9CVQ3_9ZZZZ
MGIEWVLTVWAMKGQDMTRDQRTMQSAQRKVDDAIYQLEGFMDTSSTPITRSLTKYLEKLRLTEDYGMDAYNSYEA